MAFLAHIVCNYKLSYFIIFLNYFRQFAPKKCAFQVALNI